MKIVIFGATGTLGRHLVDKALVEGHEVTAFARKPLELGRTHRSLTPLAGDVCDPKAVDQAVAGQDAVIVALGAGRKGHVRSAGTAHVVDAMQRHAVQRLVCLSTLGAGDSAQHLTFFWKHIMFGWLLKDAYEDHQAQEDTVRRSALSWTIVRPGAFTDGPETGEYRHGFPSTEKNLKLKISRADVADFMVRQLTDDTYLRQAPGLSY